ncbi:HD domain-containing protein [Breznakiella homolactica]|uniref:HD domain-containing protein n=1 Tax=Breznakiella homolactica TaxID=2798577 RepID=A0A7T8BBF3_9SPIR|nr:HD domain-containing protein [Breznakiella homolactica]QQO10502.1 HD domain-containing protein [Breznakiella homolactica]
MNAKNQLAAILEIGSTGIRLLVAEIYGNDTWHILDRAGRPVSLGRDVFTSGQVSRESFMECLSVLQNFRELIAGWGVADDDIHVIATSALRAAKNRDMIVDRVRQETGFRISIVEGIEENRLMYLAVRFALKNDFPLFWRANSLIIDVGGGSTELMLLRRGKMVAAHSLRLGTILVDQQSRLATGSAVFQERYLNENVRNTAELLRSEMDLSYVRTFVAAGSDARMVARNIGWEFNENCWIADRTAFIKFIEKISSYSVEECVKKLKIPYVDAEGIIPGLLIYKLFLERTAANRLIVPTVSIREGMLINLTAQVDPEIQEEFFSQVIASAMNLGRKYRYDEAHNRHVASLSLVLFDALVQEHGMGRRDRLLLEVAAILHDIGMFIRSSGHHRHGQYIVANSEVFGLHKDELSIVSNVVRYHRSELPSETDIDYIALQREERVLVQKMAAILRVADALDRGHSQQIKSITVERRNDMVFITPSGVHDTSLERIGLEEKGNLFENVFGYKIMLA